MAISAARWQIASTPLVRSMTDLWSRTSPMKISTLSSISSGSLSNHPADENELYWTMARTEYPRSTRTSTRCEAMNPSDPVTAMVVMFCLNLSYGLHTWRVGGGRVFNGSWQPIPPRGCKRRSDPSTTATSTIAEGYTTELRCLPVTANNAHPAMSAAAMPESHDRMARSRRSSSTMIRSTKYTTPSAHCAMSASTEMSPPWTCQWRPSHRWPE